MRKRKQSLLAMSAFGLGLALIGGGLPRTAEAAALTSLNIDPTRHSVYLQFSTHEPFDAWRMIVKLPNGTVVGVDGGHPHGGTAASGMVSGLSSGTRYRLILKIRSRHGGRVVDIPDIEPFATNP